MGGFDEDGQVPPPQIDEEAPLSLSLSRTHKRTMLAPSLIVLSLLAAASAAPSSPSSSTSSASSASSSSLPTYNYTLSAKGFTSDAWIDGFEKARKIVSQMTLSEKGAFFFPSSARSLPLPSPLCRCLIVPSVVEAELTPPPFAHYQSTSPPSLPTRRAARA
jgi:hypothetical protein